MNIKELEKPSKLLLQGGPHITEDISPIYQDLFKAYKKPIKQAEVPREQANASAMTDNDIQN